MLGAGSEEDGETGAEKGEARGYGAGGSWPPKMVSSDGLYQ